MPISLIIDLDFSVLMWKEFPPSPPLSLALKSWYLKHNWTHFYFCFRIDRKRYRPLYDGGDWENGKVTCVKAPPHISLDLMKLAKERSAKYKLILV